MQVVPSVNSFSQCSSELVPWGLPALPPLKARLRAKATFAYSSLVSLPACNTTDAAGCGGQSDTGWRPILRQQIKTANQKDLFFGASLQCGIVTDTTVKSMNGSLDTAEARGTVRVRIKITPAYGPAVYAQPSSGADATNTSSGVNGGVCSATVSKPSKRNFRA